MNRYGVKFGGQGVRYSMIKWLSQRVMALIVIVFSLLSQVHADITEYEKDGITDKQCDISLNYDLHLDKDVVTVKQGDKELYRIDNGQLWIQSEAISLDAEQQQLLTDYTQSLSKQVPEVALLVQDAIKLASEMVLKVLKPLLGDDAQLNVEKFISNLQQRVESLSYQDGQKAFVGATQNSIDNVFGEEFDQEVEQFMETIMQKAMIQFGEQLLQSDGASFEDKIEAFASQMEHIAVDIEQEVEQQSRHLKQRAEQLCGDIKQVSLLEQQIRDEIPALQAYPLFD